jgi:hypothetical protein
MRAAASRTVSLRGKSPGGDEVENLGLAFQRNADGSWTCLKPTTLEGPNGRIQVSEGSTYRRGMLFMGIELARWLDEQFGLNPVDDTAS